MERIKTKLKQRRGSVMVQSALVCLVCVMFLAVCVDIGRIFITVNMLKSKTDAAVLAVAAVNVDNVYAGVRESAGNARVVSDGAWSEIVTTEEVKDSLINVLSLNVSGQALVRITPKGSIVYQISNIGTMYTNSDGSNLNFKTTFTVTIPLNFLDINFNQNLEVSTTYDAKF